MIGERRERAPRTAPARSPHPRPTGVGDADGAAPGRLDLGHDPERAAIEPVGTPDQRRRRALLEAVNEITEAGGRARPRWAIRAFGPGRSAVALGGRFTRDASAVLSRALRELAHAGCQELVVDLSGLRGGEKHLTRTLGQARIWFLVAGARVEWHNLTPGLESQLAASEIESFTTTEESADSPTGPTPPPHPAASTPGDPPAAPQRTDREGGMAGPPALTEVDLNHEEGSHDG